MNISSDSILIDTGDKYRITLPRDAVEELLGKELVELYKKDGFQNVVVLNGPGGFTNLRVGTLCLNVLNTLLNNQLSFYDVSKINLYKKAYESGYLPKYGIIYIGQKRNIWLRDFENNERINQFSFTDLEKLKELNEVENIFIDDVDDKNYYPDSMNKYTKYHIVFDGEVILLIDEKEYNRYAISFDDLNLQPLKSIAPNYMMEPSITITTK